MPAWSFKPRFRAALENGLAELERRPPPHPGIRPKRQTIRALRRDCRDPLPGQSMRLWVAQRTPDRVFLGVVPRITRREIEIEPTGLVWLDGSDRHLAAKAGCTRLARADGFESFDDMLAFFRADHGLTETFRGYLYRW